MSFSCRLEGVYQCSALDMGHAEEVTSHRMWQHAINGLISNNDVLLEVELARIGGYITACYVNGFRERGASL